MARAPSARTHARISEVGRGAWDACARNPGYLGMALTYAGIAIVANAPWALVPLPIVIAVIDRGHKVAEGTSDQLKSQVGSSTLQLLLLDPAQTNQAVDVVRRVVGDEPVLTPEAGGINVPLPDANRAADVLIGLREQELLITSATVQKPTLDEVFMALTGHAAEESESNEEMEAVR